MCAFFGKSLQLVDLTSSFQCSETHKPDWIEWNSKYAINISLFMSSILLWCKIQSIFMESWHLRAVLRDVKHVLFCVT